MGSFLLGILGFTACSTKKATLQPPHSEEKVRSEFRDEIRLMYGPPLREYRVDSIRTPQDRKPQDEE